MSDRLTVADVLLGHGLALFDLPPGARTPSRYWHGRCTTARASVQGWIRAGDNLGIGCHASNVAVLDLDRHAGEPDGLEAFAALCDQLRQPWPATFTNVTPTNEGRHLFFRVPAGRIVASTSGPGGPLGAGVDIRGPGRQTGGYVLAPGSVVAAGEYRILHDRPIIELPQWLAIRISEPANRPLRLPRQARRCSGRASDGLPCGCQQCRRRTQFGR